MSDRLSQLLRQRALLQEHLAWLDREIAAAMEKSGTSPVGPAPDFPGSPVPPAPPAPPSVPLTPPLASASAPIVATTVTEVFSGPAEAAAAEEIIQKYRVPTNNLQQDVKKGCLIYFAAAFVLLGALVIGLYYLVSSR